MGFLVIVLMLAGCGGKPVKLAGIAGKWVHNTDNNQVWSYEFKNDKEVRFALDKQRKKWSITNIRQRGTIYEIDIDELLGQGAGQNSTIKVEILAADTVFISSGMHPGMVFKKSE